MPGSLSAITAGVQSPAAGTAALV